MKRERFYSKRDNWLRQYQYASLLLLGFSITANAATYPFEGYWGENEDCSIESASAQYTAEYMRFNLQGCDYSEAYGEVKQVAANHWKIQATCLVPFTEEDENGETWRGNRDVDSLIELKINNNQLTESWVIDYEGYDKEPTVTEYYRCQDNKTSEEENSTTNNTLKQAKALFEQAEQLNFRAELAEPPSAAEKKQIYRLYQAAYDAGYKQAAGALGIATLYGYNQADIKDAQPDWDKAELGSIEKNPKYCIALYKRASDLGDHQATMRLGIILSKQAFFSYKEMSEEHLPLNSMLTIDEMWALHKEASQFDEMVDIPRGLALLKKAAKAGNLVAWKVLAKYYYVQKEKNLEREEYYLYEGAKRGNGELLAQLAERFGDISDTAGKEKNIPIPDLYERCPRHFTEENHAS